MTFLTQSFQKKSVAPGFTLVEILVVIAVAGILSSAAFVFLASRNKTKDAGIVDALRQVRVIAEGLYDGDYDALPVNDSALTEAGSDANFGGAAADIAAQGGRWLKVRRGTGQADPYYLFWSDLNRGGLYCVDSAGTNKEIPETVPAVGAVACP